MDHPTFSTALELKAQFDFTYLDRVSFNNQVTKKKFARHYEKAKRNGDEFSFWQGAFYQNDIMQARWPSIYIKWIDDEIGYGVFASQSMPAKMYVGEYTGIICQRTFRFKFNVYCMALLRDVGRFRKFLINGKSAGNFTRFFNHSSCPNLNLQTVYTEDMPHMIFTTNQYIEKDQQLTFDYGESYWRQCQKIPKVI